MDLQPLDFEKPIVELERRLHELKEHSREHDVDLDSEVEAIETKLRDTRREIYGNLSAWQRVQIARHVQRPFALDYVERCFTGWTIFQPRGAGAADRPRHQSRDPGAADAAGRPAPAE